MNTTRLNVYTHIIIRTSDVDQIFTYMRFNFVMIGKVVPSLQVMKRAVDASKNALTLMGGKNNSFIR